jgi:hypothetical protein
MRESARTVAGSLPRGTYLLRAEPAAAATEPASLSAHVKEAMRQAGRAEERS